MKQTPDIFYQLGSFLVVSLLLIFCINNASHFTNHACLIRRILGRIGVQNGTRQGRKGSHVLPLE